MAEQNARQRMKLLPSTESHSHRPSSWPPNLTKQFNTSKLGRHTSSRETRVVTRETIGDGANIQHGPSNESNQEL